MCEISERKGTHFFPKTEKKKAQITQIFTVFNSFSVN